MAKDDPAYHFFVVTEVSREREVQKMTTEQSLQAELFSLFDEQAKEFMANEPKRIDFDPRYSIDDDDEIFAIKCFKLPGSLSTAIENPIPVEQFLPSQAPVGSTKAILCSFTPKGAAKPTIYFQRTSRSKWVDHRKLLFIEGDTFTKVRNRGLMLESSLAAIYDGDALFFRSYRTVNSFLSLADYFNQATDEDIAAVIEQNKVQVDDRETLLKMCDTQVRKMFSYIQAAKVLSDVGARTIANRAEKYGLEIKTKRIDGKDVIELPSEKKTLKLFLSFLCERLYEGPLTGKHYQTNSNRQVS
ncbi:MAG: hypothetical protein P4L84_06575 [Isosphaeraceae bacterium]|nr:hypothetical protein [Isosphaeraceae bacterium]